MSRRPVDLNFGNSIVQAFAQGRAEALERLRNQQAQQQIAIQNEQQRQKAEEDRRQFEAQLSQRETEFKAEQELAKLGYDLNKTKGKVDIEGALRQIVQQGGIPSGFSQEQLPGLQEEVRQMPTIFGQPAFEQELIRFRRQAGQSDLLPETITERNPAAIKREAILAEQAKFQRDQAALDAAQGRTQENEILKSNLFSVEKQAELKNAMEIARMNNARALEIAKLNLSVKQSAGEEVPALVPLLIQNPDAIYDKGVGTPKQLGDALGWLAKNGYDVKSQNQKVVNDLAPRTLAAINKVLDNPNFVSGFSSVIKNIPGTDAFQSNVDLDSVKAALTLPEIKYIKGLGQMSDSDRDFITRLATSINIGSKDLIPDLKRLKKIYEKIIKDTTPNVTPKDTTKTGTPATGQGSKMLLESFDRTKR